jgi:mRNA interferase RelE/StbE
MPYKVLLTETVARLVSEFHPELKRYIKSALKRISQDPYRGKALQADLEGYFSYRLKRYRIIYALNEAEKAVIVHLIRHRRDVYDLVKDIRLPK